MFSLGQIFVFCLGLFILVAWFISSEKRKDKRIFSSLRESLDNVIRRVTNYLAVKITYIGRHTIKLSWYYGVHKILRFILSLLVQFYDFLEAIFTKNRDRARKLKLEKKQLSQNEGHLGQVAEHKASVSLSPQQKKKLLQKKLERG